jgi:hypothetical protein
MAAWRATMDLKTPRRMRRLVRVEKKFSIRFFNAAEREAPAGKIIHAMLDNYVSTR